LRDVGKEGGGPGEHNPQNPICKRLLAYEAAVSQLFEDFINAKTENDNPPWWRDSNPTQDDWGKAFVGAVIGAIVFRNPAGAAIGIGISIAGNTLYIEGQNLIDPRVFQNQENFQKTYKEFYDKAQEMFKEMKVSTEEFKTWQEFRHSGGNCGGAGGSW